jgi:hypothetical protein
MPIKPGYLLLTAAGAIVVYSGLKGKGIGATTRSIISGQDPRTVPQLVGEMITGVPGQVNQTGGGPPTGPGIVGTAPTPTGSEDSWIRSFLIAVGAPTTPANVSSVSAWIAHEGDFATSGNNALNTTQSNSDSIGTKNSIGVQIFRTPSGGVNANATALLNGKYPDILMLLRSGQGLCGHQLQGLSTWSGGGYSSVC